MYIGYWMEMTEQCKLEMMKQQQIISIVTIDGHSVSTHNDRLVTKHYQVPRRDQTIPSIIPRTADEQHPLLLVVVIAIVWGHGIHRLGNGETCQFHQLIESVRAAREEFLV